MTDIVEDTSGEEVLEIQTDPIVERAMEMGWRPKEEFEGDEADFIEAKEYVQRKPLYDKIGQQSKQIKNLGQAVEALRVHNGKVEQAAYNKALEDLRGKRVQALQEGEFYQADKLENEIKSVERQVQEIQKQPPLVQVEPEIHPEFAQWQNKNPWYQSTKYMREFADEVGSRLAGTATPGEVLKLVESAVRKEFPHKFSNPNKVDAPSVGVSKNAGRVKDAEISMPEEDRKIMNTILRATPNMTKEDYIKQYKLIHSKGN